MSPSALSSGMLIVVEEMVLLAARPVVLATMWARLSGVHSA